MVGWSSSQAQHRLLGSASVVRDTAASLGIVLMPLLGYSLDLMPVEALWR